MKHLSVLVAVVGLIIVVETERAEAQAVNANITTICGFDSSLAAIAPAAWTLVVGGANSQAASVNTYDCNTAWSVSAIDGAATPTGQMVPLGGSMDAGGVPVTSALTDPLLVNTNPTAAAAPVGSGGPTLSTDTPVTYVQPAQFADVAINPATGNYVITLVYTLTFTP